MKFITKDITTIEGPAIIIHGVNCQGAMGSGIARSIYEKWPRVRGDYIHYGSMELGNIQPVAVGGKLWVVNCFTQFYYGGDKKKYADPSAILGCLGRLSLFAQSLSIYDIYSPRIGCGLGGLDWDSEVLSVFELAARVSPIQFTICGI